MQRTSQQQQQPDADASTMRQAAREVIDILHEISVLLNTNLDRPQLSLCVSLIENGVNPEALANVIKMLREQAGKSGDDAAVAVKLLRQQAGKSGHDAAVAGEDGAVVRRTL